MKINRLHHCAFSLTSHLVLVTKYRSKCLNAKMLDRMAELFESTASAWGAEVLEFNGERDHVHALLSLPPTLAPAAFVNNLKTVSSMVLRREFEPELRKFFWKFTEKGLWSRSYCILSSGGAPLEVLKRYIENQDRPS